MVPLAGLEPARDIIPVDFKSTMSAIPSQRQMVPFGFECQKRFAEIGGTWARYILEAAPDENAQSLDTSGFAGTVQRGTLWILSPLRLPIPPQRREDLDACLQSG